MAGVCQGLGQLRLVGSQQPVLFHLGQALRHTHTGHAPYLETHTRAELEWLLKPGTRVTLNARKIRGCYLPLQVRTFYFTTYCNAMTWCQATAVWVSKEVPPAKQYKSSELVARLSLALHDFILLRTGDTRC